MNTQEPYCSRCCAPAGKQHNQGCGSQEADLDARIRRAREAFDALTPEQQAAFRREQAIDFAYGQLMATTRHRTGITRELVAEAYDKSRGAPDEAPCAHPVKVGGNDCLWCPDCGEDLLPTASQPSKGSE